MASFENWFEKFRYNVDIDVWNLMEYSCAFLTSHTVKSGLGIYKPETFNLDSCLCPELFITGLYDLYFFLKTNDLANYPEQMQRDFKSYQLIIDHHKNIIKTIITHHADISDEATLNSYLYSRLLKSWTMDNSFFVDELKGLFLTAKEKHQVVSLAKIFAFISNLEPQIEQSQTEQSQTEQLRQTCNFAELSTFYADLRNKLSEQILGQDAAISRFVQGLFAGTLNSAANRKGPEATFLFVGPPGVGKTFLATSAAQYLNRPSMVFQMNEYTGKNSIHSIVGFESTFKESEDGKLTEYVEKNPSALLIFDEIEKAHPDVIRLFLSVLEGGTLQSLYTKKDVDFTNTVIIFTTNAGRDFYEENRDMLISSIPEHTIGDALKKDKDADGLPKMPSEILSRLSKGYIIGFDHMNPAKLIPIIKSGLQAGSDMLFERFGISCTYNESQFPYLFLFHLGSQLDARVAKERSKNFIIDTVYNIAERAGENPDRYQTPEGDPLSHIYFEVTDGEPLAKEFLEPPEKSNIIMVSYKTDRQKVENETDWYSRFDAWDTSDTNEEGRQSKILEIMDENKISAILIDPYFATMEYGNQNLDHMEGILHLNSRGTNVLRWLLKQKNMPPIYILEMTQHISLVDRIELQSQGVKGFLDFVGKSNEECTTMVDDLAYELFLSKKIDYITSKGRALDFNIGQEISDTYINLKLFNFKLINNMTMDAAQVTITDADKPDTLFDDVIGADNAKKELRRFIRFLKNPEDYRRTGMQVSKGILLYGPPGTGKTKLAKALACEADCPFISTTGAQFVNGSKDITSIFRLAKRYSPSVVFIDEIDSFALDRRNSDSMRATILNNLLTAMDGFSSNSGKPVFVIAATNAADAPGLNENNIHLDPALLRRFSKKVFVDLPSTEERKLFLTKQQEALTGKDFNLNDLSPEDLLEFAKHTAGRSIAELENALNLAIGEAVTLNQNVTLDILRDVFDESIYGEKIKISPDHIRTTALHESGHAFMCYKYKERFKPQFATLVARGDYLGMVSQEPQEEGLGFSKEELLQRMQICLAGRAAEIIFNGKEKGLTTGASNDFNHATRLAMGIVCRYGMEDGFLPVVDPYEMLQSPLAEKYFNQLNEIMRIQLEETIAILSKNKDTIERLANALLEKSHLDFDDIERIITE